MAAPAPQSSTTRPRRLVVKLTSGAEAPERANQALTVAATAAASGFDVSLWLTGEASWLGTTSATSYDLAHSADPLELLDAVAAAGTVTVCSQCAVRRGIESSGLRAGVRIVGAAVFVEEVTEPDVRALVY